MEKAIRQSLAEKKRLELDRQKENTLISEVRTRGREASPDMKEMSRGREKGENMQKRAKI